MDTVFAVDAATAAIVLLAWAWPLWRSIRAAALDSRAAGRTYVVALSLIGLLAVSLRLWAFQPTFLFSLPDAYQFLDKVAHPLDNAGWHPYHLGGFVFLGGLARLFGDGPGVIWTTNAIAGALAAVLLFPLVVRLAGQSSAALVASFLLAVHAPSVRVDSSEQLSSLSVLTAIVALLSVAEVARKCSWQAVLSASIALAALTQFRLDAIALCGFAVLTFFLVPGTTGGFRALRPLLALLAVSALLVAPRFVSIACAMVREWPSGGGAVDLWSLETTRRLVFSDRSIFLTVPRFVPVYPLLLLAGLGALAWRREWRRLAFFVAGVLFALFEVHGWTLDVNDALRFQDITWFLLVVVAGIGADALASLAGSPRRTGIAIGVICAAAALAFVAAWPVLGAQPAFDRSAALFRRNLPDLPPDCRLLLPRPSPDPPWGPGHWPSALLTGWHGLAPRYFPEDLASTDSDACRIAFLGVECQLRYPPDEEVRQWPANSLFFVLIDKWKHDVDDHGGYPERDECRALRDRHVLEPLVTEVIDAGRPSFGWLPSGTMEIGFYRLAAHR
jgi:hypothetical protein